MSTTPGDPRPALSSAMRRALRPVRAMRTARLVLGRFYDHRVSDRDGTSEGTMGEKALHGLPPTTWIHRVDVVLAASLGVRTHHLLERAVTLREWFSRNLEPEHIVAKMDPVDKAVARWLSGFGESTHRTYERALRRLAVDIALPGVDDARALLRRTIDAPDAVEILLARYALASRAKTGTIRNRLCVLHLATVALHEAGLARRAVDVCRPEDTDVDLSVPTVEQLDSLDSRLARSEDPLDARGRAVMLLAADGVRAHELPQLDIQHYRLTHVVVGRELVRLAVRTTDALHRWLEQRGTKRGPLFVGFDGRTGRLRFERLTTRAFERDMERVSRGTVTLRSLRRFAVVHAVARDGWSAGDRVARLTQRHGVTRMVDGARSQFRS